MTQPIKTYHVTAAIIYQQDKILIARRAPDKHLSGYWEFPGGKIEAGETPQECLKREIKEELGIGINVGDFFMENEHHYGEKIIRLQAFECEHVSGDITLSDHDQIAWITRTEFKNYDFAPADLPFIKSLHGKQ
jgi:8-oxo-dGTP diphosphatase